MSLFLKSVLWFHLTNASVADKCSRIFPGCRNCFILIPRLQSSYDKDLLKFVETITSDKSFDNFPRLFYCSMRAIENYSCNFALNMNSGRSKFIRASSLLPFEWWAIGRQVILEIHENFHFYAFVCIHFRGQIFLILHIMTFSIYIIRF